MIDDKVARYYDSNTGRFLLVGGRGVHAIHRELWGAGVASVHDAADHVNQLLAREILSSAQGEQLTIIDLGCGVGGTVFRLAELMPKSRLHGVTVSSRQHTLALELAAQKHLEERTRFWLGDFHVLDIDLEADAIVAVEAFAHSEEPLRFFSNVARHLRGDGIMILVDDFVEPLQHPGTRQERVLKRFRSGWRVPGVGSVVDCISAAQSAGLELIRDQDLTSLIRLGRPRDRLIALLSPFFHRLGLGGVPFFGNMIGGNALQIGIREGFLRYRMLVFKKAPREA